MKLELTKIDFNKFYLHNYFYAQKKLYRYLRQFLGPVLVIVGFYLLYEAPEKFNIWFIAFCIAFGFFYSFLPFILLIARNPKDEIISFEFLEKKRIRVSDRSNKATIDLKKNKLTENKRYFLIHLENGQALFFPKEKLNNETIGKFKDALES